MVTIKDIAREAGVSYATVSRALNNLSGTRDSTALRIKSIAKAMGYQRNTLAAGLVTKRTHTIGFILPEIENPFFTSILNAVSSVADQYNYTVLVCSTGWDVDKEKKELKTLAERRVDGILLYPSSDLSSKDGRLDCNGVPWVLYGDLPELDENRPNVIKVDNIQAGRMALAHVMDCGYERLAYLGGPKKSASSVARLLGVKDALAKRGLVLDEKNVTEDKYTINSGYERCLKMLKRTAARRPDAFICGNDLIAMGAMQAVSEAGYKVGEEIGVIGFDDVPYASLPQIQLSTMRIPCSEMGEVGMLLLLKQILADDEEGLLNENFDTSMQATLVIRKTTRGGQG